MVEEYGQKWQTLTCLFPAQAVQKVLKKLEVHGPVKTTKNSVVKSLAFHPYSYNQSLTLDDGYVDGVPVTYNYPREHIWI